MKSPLRRVAISTGIVGLFAGLFAVVALVALSASAGCDGLSPFLAAQFANTISGEGLAQGGPDTEPEEACAYSNCDSTFHVLQRTHGCGVNRAGKA